MHPTHKVRAIQQRRLSHHRQQTDAYDFFNLLTGDELLSVIESVLPDHRERLYPPTETLAMFLAQALSADGSCQRAVNEMAIKRTLNGLSPMTTNTGAYCRARQRLPMPMVSCLTQYTGRLVAQWAPVEWHWRGRRLKLIDGTTVTMPDTVANQSVYPQQGNQRPGLGFPIARIVGVICLGSGTLLDAAMGPYQGKGNSEHGLFRAVLGSLNTGDIAIADRYYCSFFIIAALLAKGVDVVFQQHASRHTDFRRGERLGARDHVVAWHKPKQKPQWMTQRDYDQYPEQLHLREVQADHKILVTSLLSPKQAGKQEIAQLYRQRWHIEVDLRSIKTTLGMETLDCKTPDMNEKQMWVYFLAYNLIRLIMAQSASQADLLPRKISFKHALQIWTLWSANKAFTLNNEHQVIAILALIAQQTVGNRPGRIEPRAIKRRPKPYPLLMKPRLQAQEDVRKYGHPKKIK
jgi:hypothetical protein